MIIVLLAAAHALAAIVGRPEPRDERDRIISWRAESNPSWLLAAGVLGAITAILFSLPNVWVADVLLLSLFASQVLYFALQPVYYRRGV